MTISMNSLNSDKASNNCKCFQLSGQAKTNSKPGFREKRSLDQLVIMHENISNYHNIIIVEIYKDI